LLPAFKFSNYKQLLPLLIATERGERRESIVILILCSLTIPSKLAPAQKIDPDPE